MARVRLAGDERGEFGVEYNDRNGRASAVYCTHPAGASATVTLVNGNVITQSLSAGQTMPVPGNQVQVTLDPAAESMLVGVASISFQWGG